jgi:hypothetical protein
MCTAISEKTEVEKLVLLEVLMRCNIILYRCEGKISPKLGRDACCYWHWCIAVVQAGLSNPTAHEPPQLAVPVE